MTFQTVVDAWASDLQANVTGLDTTTIPAAQLHLYTPWSVEEGFASSGERHLAIWPEGEPEVVNAAIAATHPADLAVASYVIVVWEDASADTARLQDNETAAKTWLTLFEAIRARLYLESNSQNGSVDATRYAGGSFDFRAGARILTIRFQTRQFYQFS